MDTLTNVGLIDYNTPIGDFKVDAVSDQRGFRLKKVMVKDASPEIIRLHYPQSEIVQDKQAIIHDSSIDLIVISGAAEKELDLVAEVLQTGKHVRIV
jgi:predicted dehydrogenase